MYFNQKYQIFQTYGTNMTSNNSDDSCTCTIQHNSLFTVSSVYDPAPQNPYKSSIMVIYYLIIVANLIN